jgi:WD40 repeat protein/transcriptional regulator with XRE-family HTH domain
VTTHIPFHEQLRFERERRGWSQADLAEKVGCDTKTVGRWESGVRFPRPYHRQILCELFGKNAEDLGLVQEASLLPMPETTQPDQPMHIAIHMSNHASSELLQEDWGEAPYVAHLYGRNGECNELEQWIGDHRCQMVAILGMGGVGKTAIAAIVAARMKNAFKYVFWRSLHNALPLEHFLNRCIRFVSDQYLLDLPKEVDDQITLLIQYLRNNRCLLVLDNFESVLQAGRRAGHYREGYAAYGRLLQRVGEAQHQSCLLLTSREKPKEVAHLEGKRSPVRSLHLSGLRLEAGKQMLQDKGLFGSDAHWLAFVESYSGNPLALQVVSESIQAVFEGNIDKFLQEQAIAFGDINDLLDQQFHRLSAQEREIMYWLAIEREAMSLESLGENLVYPMSIGTQLEALDSLRRRSLIETRGTSSFQFTLQPVIMEYVTTSLVKRAYREFDTESPDVWVTFALSKAQAKDYMRESQVRLLLAPVAQRLLARLGRVGIEQKVREILTRQRQVHAQQPGYLAGNILNLLSYLDSDLRGFDFSHLVVRQAYLQGVMLPEANFAHSHFIASSFTNTFGNILAVAYSPQGHLLAAGTTTGEVWIYDALGCVPRLICHGHTDGVWSLAFSPDARLLASSSDDHTVRLWNSNSGHCLKMLKGHTNRVRAIAFSPGGSTLASGSDDQTIRLWDVSTGDCLTTLHGHTSRVWSVAYNLDGNLLASGSTDQTVRLWDTSTGSCLTTMYGHSGWVRSVVFHLKESILASGSDDQTIRLWDVSTGDCLTTLHGHTSRVWSVAFRAASDVVGSSSEDQTIRIWNIRTNRCLMILQGHTQGVRSIAFTPDGYMLASGGDDQTIHLWDVTTGHCLQTVQGYTNRVWSIVFSSDGSILASGSENSIIRMWDVTTGHCLKMLQNRSHGVLVVAFSPHGFKLASGGQDQTIRLWDGNTGRSLTILRGHTNWVRAVIFSPKGDTLASGSEDQTIRLWDINTGSCRCILQGHTSWVRSLAFSPDGNMLASGADDQTVRLWNVTDGRCLRTLQGHTNRVRGIVFSPDGNVLVSCSEDQTIRLWNVGTGYCFNILKGHSGWIRSVAFSPDGNMLASGADDQTVRLWDTTTWHCIKALQGHSNRVRRVTFSPDSHTLASSSDDGTIKLWDIQSAICLKTLISEKPYERMNITHVQGLTEAQKANLQALGAIEES